DRKDRSIDNLGLAKPKRSQRQLSARRDRPPVPRTQESHRLKQPRLPFAPPPAEPNVCGNRACRLPRLQRSRLEFGHSLAAPPPASRKGRAFPRLAAQDFSGGYAAVRLQRSRTFVATYTRSLSFGPQILGFHSGPFVLIQIDAI